MVKAKKIVKQDPLIKYMGEKLQVEMPPRLGGNRPIFKAYATFIKALERNDGSVHFVRDPYVSLGNRWRAR